MRSSHSQIVAATLWGAIAMTACNRASPSAYLRGHRQSTFHTLHWLRHLERIGIPVVNGSSVYSFELSKATQLDLLEELGLAYPRSRVINDPALSVEAAKLAYRVRLDPKTPQARREPSESRRV